WAFLSFHLLSFLHFIPRGYCAGILASFTDLHHSLLLHQNKNWAVFFHHKNIAAILSGYGHKFLRVSNNLDLKMGLFIFYVREYFIVKQITIKMYQVAGEERFLFWAVCNIQLQVMSSVTTLIFFISFAPPPET
ncbi:hypothetical protein MTR67_010479, partial [Solanum verrucosum]